MSHLQAIMPAVSLSGIILGIVNVIFATYSLLLRRKSRANKDRASNNLPMPLIGCMFLMGIESFVNGVFQVTSGIGNAEILVKTVDIVCNIGIFPLAIYQCYLLAKD